MWLTDDPSELIYHRLVKRDAPAEDGDSDDGEKKEGFGEKVKISGKRSKKNSTRMSESSQKRRT